MRILALGLALLVPHLAAADEFKNDSFNTGDTVAFQGGFAAGEIAAARFIATGPTTIEKVQLLFGPDGPQRTITLKIWDDTAGTLAPGTELASEDFQVPGSSSAMHELQLPVAKDVPPQFRVGIVLTAGAPSVANDTEAQSPTFPDRNYIMEASLGWQKSTTFSVHGDWVIRAFSPGGAVPDGAAGDAGATGMQCAGNAECPVGEFCDLGAHACTFECRDDPDCGGGTCNSLGQCVGGEGGGGGGGCCETGSSGSGAAVLAALVGFVALRRRWS